MKETAKDMKPILGITMGDPCGIGPEITAKALACPEASRCGKSCSSWRTLACAPARPQAAIEPRKWASEAVG